MIRFKITPARFAEACNIYELINTENGDLDTVVRVMPRFIVDEAGEYLVTVVTDGDGDLEAFQGLEAARLEIAKITPKRLEKLKNEFCEAARAIVNPPKDGG